MAQTYRRGEYRVTPYAEYEPGAGGFVIELLYSEPDFWAIPAWDERGRPDLEGVFGSIVEAVAALS